MFGASVTLGRFHSDWSSHWKSLGFYRGIIPFHRRTRFRLVKYSNVPRLTHEIQITCVYQLIREKSRFEDQRPGRAAKTKTTGE